MPNPLEIEKQTSATAKLLALLPSKERASARIVLSRNDVESVYMLARLKFKEQTKKGFRTIVSVTTAGVGGLLLDRFLSHGGHFGSSAWILTAIGTGIVVFLTLSPVNYLQTRLEKAILEAFLHCENVWCIGPLLTYLHELPRSQHTNVMTRLTRLLPQLTPETGAQLTPIQHGSLHGILDHLQRDSNPELRLAVLAALQEVGDWSCLGAVYLLATGEAFTRAAQSVRDAARTCLDHLCMRLDFGPLNRLPQHIDNVSSQMRAADSVDFQLYAICILTLQQLLLQLTPTNYRDYLSEQQRDLLYSLPVQYPSLEGGMHRYRKRDLHWEIVRTAERLGDTRAIKAFQAFARNPPADTDKQIAQAMNRALHTLEPLIQREKESQTLLRGTNAPDVQPEELLRPAIPNVSQTNPDELLRATPPYQEQVVLNTEILPEESQSVQLQSAADTEP